MDFYRTISSTRMLRFPKNETSDDRAIHLYQNAGQDVALQVRGPSSRKDGSEGKDFVVAEARLTRDDLVALRDACNEALGQTETPKAKPTTEEEAKNVAEALSRFVNHYGIGQDAAFFVDEVTHDHRTLQQQIFGLFMLCVKAWSEAHEARRFDARNEFTCRLSAEIMKAISGEWNGRVPMI